MTGNDIRQGFLDYFARHGHAVGLVVARGRGCVASQKKTQIAQAPLTRRTQKDAGRAGQSIPPEL